MSISKIRENAREALNGKWGKAACFTLAYLAFFLVAGFVVGLFGEESLLGSLLDLATSIIQVPIVFGLTFAFIKLKRNEEVKAFDYLNIGFSNFGRAWKIGLRLVLKEILPTCVLAVGLCIMLVGCICVMFEPYAVIKNPIPLIIIGAIISLIAIIWLISIVLLYALTTCIAYDNPNMSSLEVVNESAKMMKGNRGKYFLLELSFIGWAILAAFTLGIGYLWLLPYMQVAVICFYEHLLGKNENVVSEENVEAITEM